MLPVYGQTDFTVEWSLGMTATEFVLIFDSKFEYIDAKTSVGGCWLDSRPLPSTFDDSDCLAARLRTNVI